ncbi:MAG: hypothetical protein K0S18_28 [Anaerocolumna sp.]|jgi:hypothetical protein|nr:hypothetical protein [Anaerocolumna sp.]
MEQSDGNKAGEALRTILNRLKTIKDEPVEECKKRGCFHCKNYVRREGYNQQWGMYQFYNNYCNKGVEEDKHMYMDKDCVSFELGENQYIYMSDKEKRRIERGCRI